jgi:3-hydroxyisobutyrate dehydrogenase
MSADSLALPPRATVILTSTVSPSAAEAIASLIAGTRPDVGFLDCPVSGGTPRAATGDLTLLASGLSSKSGNPAEALAVLRALSGSQGNSSNLFLVPGKAGRGAAIKLINQHLAGEP